MKNTLVIHASIQVNKSREEVFEAIVDPEKMKNYFISKSTGKMEEGKTVTWNFPEFKVDVPVRTGKLIKPEYISFYWGEEGKEEFVEIMLTEGPKSSTILNVTEKEKENNEEGISWLKGNTEGWANFLACLKAYLEYGINLRKGAFDYRSDLNN
jgi:uncharacterized protein YndB with AHSA1/START domain